LNYAAKEVSIAGQTNVNVALTQNSDQLGDVVVIGYGSVRKKDLTGSVASISSKDFVKGQLTSPEQLIAGKVAGVQITSNGGAPGSGSTIRIRGGASLNASNNPLIVIDNVPLSESGVAGAANAWALTFNDQFDIMCESKAKNLASFKLHEGNKNVKQNKELILEEACEA
jgi:iron complex outermembrane receptor protein